MLRFNRSAKSACAAILCISLLGAVGPAVAADIFPARLEVNLGPFPVDRYSNVINPPPGYVPSDTELMAELNRDQYENIIAKRSPGSHVAEFSRQLQELRAQFQASLAARGGER